jgi:hypothetical protein
MAASCLFFVLFFSFFYLFVCPRHILRRWSQQKGSDLHTRFDDGSAFLIANSSMREGPPWMVGRTANMRGDLLTELSLACRQASARRDRRYPNLLRTA